MQGLSDMCLENQQSLLLNFKFEVTHLKAFFCPDHVLVLD